MELLALSPVQLLLAVAFVAAAASLLPIAGRLNGGGKSRGRRRYHPVTGTVVHQIFHFRRLYDYLTDLSRRHKSFRIFVSPFQSLIYTTDPAVVEHILRTNFRNYGKGMRNYENMKDLLGDGIFAVDGEKWQKQRKLASFEFSTRSLREHSAAVFRKNAVKLAAALSDAADARQVIELQDWFMKSMMDTITEVAFGTELDCLRGSSEESTRFARAFDESTQQINSRYVFPFWKLTKLLNVGAEAALKDNVKVVDEYVYRLIQKKTADLQEQRRNSGASAEKEDILSRFLREREKDPKSISPQYLRDIALNFVIAGKDSTSGTMAWFFYMLCKHPSVQEKVAREVAETVEAAGAGAEEFAANITEEALEKMQYLHAALSETLRLYPAAPVDPKECFSDDTLPDGFSVRAGESIAYQPYAMGRMEFLWGADACSFRPERWFDDNGVFCPQSPFKFTAFQAGPRICLGKDFAYRQMKIFAAVLLRFFIFKLRDEEEVLTYKLNLLLHIDGGLHLHVLRR